MPRASTPIKSIKKRPTLADIICQQIIKLISENELNPGDILPPQDELASSLGVSKGSLREALVKLEAKGFLEKEKGGLYKIRGFTSKRLVDPLEELLENDSQLVWNVLEMARILAVEAARIAALRRDESDVLQLEQIVSKMEKTIHDKEYFRREFANIYTDFFKVLGEATKNNVFLHTLHSFNEMLREAMPFPVAALKGVPKIVETIYSQFGRIARHVKDARSSEAARQAKNHFEYIECKLRDALEIQAKERA